VNYGRLGFADRSRYRLNEHGSFRIIGGFSPGVFHAMLPVCTQKVKTQAVFLRIDFVQQCSPQSYPLGWFQKALEDGELNTLSVIHTQTCNTA